jgi:hypothetical protein
VIDKFLQRIVDPSEKSRVEGNWGEFKISPLIEPEARGIKPFQKFISCRKVNKEAKFFRFTLLTKKRNKNVCLNPRGKDTSYKVQSMRALGVQVIKLDLPK